MHKPLNTIIFRSLLVLAIAFASRGPDLHAQKNGSSAFRGVVGPTEDVELSLPDPAEKFPPLKLSARIDTGSLFNSLGITNLRVDGALVDLDQLTAETKAGKAWMSDQIGKKAVFDVRQDDNAPVQWRAEIKSISIVKGKPDRFNVDVTAAVDGVETSILMTLANRDGNGHPLLLGRPFLRSSGNLVDIRNRAKEELEKVLTSDFAPVIGTVAGLKLRDNVVLKARVDTGTRYSVLGVTPVKIDDKPIDISQLEFDAGDQTPKGKEVRFTVRGSDHVFEATVIDIARMKNVADRLIVELTGIQIDGIELKGSTRFALAQRDNLIDSQGNKYSMTYPALIGRETLKEHDLLVEVKSLR